MKRFFDDEGEICFDNSLKEAEGLIKEAFSEFVKAGYSPRDFLQFANFEASLYLYDWHIKKALGEPK